MRNVIRGEYLKAGRFKTLPVLPWLVICGLALWMLFRTEPVTADQFRRLFYDSLTNTISTWYLYSEDDESYCFRTPRPPWPDKRFCVPKTDLEVIKPPGEPVIGFIVSREMRLKADRYPGAKRETF
ncbi:MAG: hypothetical protein ACREP7_20335 [Lysobacter sp.]